MITGTYGREMTDSAGCDLVCMRNHSSFSGHLTSQHSPQSPATGSVPRRHGYSTRAYLKRPNVQHGRNRPLSLLVSRLTDPTSAERSRGQGPAARADRRRGAADPPPPGRAEPTRRLSRGPAGLPAEPSRHRHQPPGEGGTPRHARAWGPLPGGLPSIKLKSQNTLPPRYMPTDLSSPETCVTVYIVTTVTTE